MKTLTATIPFSGFYCSIHDDLIDREIEYLHCDDDGNTLEIPDDFWFNYNATDIYNAYAKRYAEQWIEDVQEETGIDLTGVKFKTLESPREYNFTTDRIIVEIPESVYMRLLYHVPTEALAERIREQFTSRDGFISFYSNDVNKWLEKPLLTWDVNEVGTLLEVISDQYEIDPVESSLLDNLYELVDANLSDKCWEILNNARDVANG